MTQLKPIHSHVDNIPSTAGKFKPDKSSLYYIYYRLRYQTSFPKFTIWLTMFLSLIVLFFFLSPPATPAPRRGLRTTNSDKGSGWESRIKLSAKPRFPNWSYSGDGVVGLDSKVPFSEKDRTDQPASLYAATKKAGLRFFTVYGPWGRPDMAYFFFTKDILNRKQISIFEGPNHGTIARDFTYIDDIVNGCLSAIDTTKKSTGTGGKKKGEAQFRIINLGNTSHVSFYKLVNILEKLLKVKTRKNMVLMPRNGDVPITHANISLACVAGVDGGLGFSFAALMADQEEDRRAGFSIRSNLQLSRICRSPPPYLILFK
ncbi:hypothetical protein LXL04_014323 [Taraxacum kok-saghyz]